LVRNNFRRLAIGQAAYKVSERNERQRPQWVQAVVPVVPSRFSEDPQQIGGAHRGLPVRGSTEYSHSVSYTPTLEKGRRMCVC
jgi:hypothetical protein